MPQLEENGDEEKMKGVNFVGEENRRSDIPNAELENSELITAGLRMQEGDGDGEEAWKRKAGRSEKADEVILSKELEEEILGPPEYTSCGIGPCSGSRWLQPLARPETYLVISSAVALVQGVYFTYSNATLSTVEKRFRLPSKLSGFITTGNDVIQLLLAIPISFFASQGHRPRWLALGMSLAVLGCLLASTPHFFFGVSDLSGRYLAGGDLTRSTKKTRLPTGLDMCHFSSSPSSSASSSSLFDALGPNNETTGSSVDDDCDAQKVSIGNQQYAVITLQVISQMLSGVASLLYYTIGYSFLDDTVSKRRSPLYLAISGCMRIFGPVCGYTLASWSLNLWEDPTQTPRIQPRHPAWIGAWWLGFLVIGGTLFVITWSLVLLPRVMPSSRRRAVEELRLAAERGAKAFRLHAQALRPPSRRPVNALIPTLGRLLCSKVFLLIVVNQILFLFSFFGYITFKSKYLEHQFKMSASKANQYIAATSMVASLVGWLGTGAVLTVFRPRAKWVLLYMAVLSALNCALHLAQMATYCPATPVHGLQMAIAKNERLTNSSTDSLSSCMADCACAAEYAPVCVEGNHTFLSACHAGCRRSLTEDNKLVYTDCTCAQHLQNTRKSYHSSVAIPFQRQLPTPSPLLSASTSPSSLSPSTLSLPSSVSSDQHITPTSTLSPPTSFSTTSSSSSSSSSSFFSSSSSSLPLHEPITARSGFCPTPCGSFMSYLIITVFTKMTMASSRVPVNLILFRCAEQRDKDVGLGVFNAAIALMASIPGPIVFGWAIDQSCVLWEKTCEKKGFCWIYDLDAFRETLHGLPAALMVGCFATEILLLCLHKRINLYGTPEDEEEEEEKVLDRNKELLKEHELEERV